MDPYQPPATPLPEPPRAAPAGFRFLPVFVGGFLIDYLGSNLVGVGSGIVAVAVAVAGGASPEDATRDAGKLLLSPAFLWPGMALGSLLTLLGGYVAARWAGNQFLAHAGAAGSISLALGSLPHLLGVMAPQAAWVLYLGFAIQIPLALAGGWLAARRARRLAPRPPSA